MSKPRKVTKTAKAAVMQPKFRKRVEKTKKGKGSYNRKQREKNNVDIHHRTS